MFSYNWHNQEDIISVGHKFVSYYYELYDTNINLVYNFYNDDAILTFENNEYIGKDNIRNKYNLLKLNKIEHKLLNINIQPVYINSIHTKIMINCVGQMRENQGFNNYKIYNYIETFILNQCNNNWCVQNHIFNIF